MIIAAICILGVGMYYSAGSETTQPLPEKEIVDTIQTQYPGKVTNVSLAQDKGIPTYEAELTGEKKKFALQLDATSGKVLDLQETEELPDGAKKQEESQKEDSNEVSTPQDNLYHEAGNSKEEKQDEKEKQKDHAKDEKHWNENYSENQESKNEQDSDQTTDEDKEKQDKKSKPVISEREAIEKALEQFSGNVDDVDLEDDDGRLYYEIEIERGDLEAEIMIDAYTGEVLIIEIDD